MSAKHKPITEEQFKNLFDLDNWKIAEIPQCHWDNIPGLQRQDGLLGVMISGSLSDPKTLNGVDSIAGFDALVHETKPMKDEPPGNAYHYVVQKTNHQDYPYLIHGPYIRETIVDHWFTAEQLDRYFERTNTEPCTAPNGGPATQLGNSSVTEGPPSVS